MRSHEAKERFRNARKLYIDRQFVQALELLDELKDVFDAYPDLHYLRARCLGKLKRADELREVARLLTERFNDPRGAEILTWFVRKPVDTPRTMTPTDSERLQSLIADLATPTDQDVAETETAVSEERAQTPQDLSSTTDTSPPPMAEERPPESDLPAPNAQVHDTIEESFPDSVNLAPVVEANEDTFAVPLEAAPEPEATDDPSNPQLVLSTQVDDFPPAFAFESDDEAAEAEVILPQVQFEDAIPAITLAAPSPETPDAKSGGPRRRTRTLGLAAGLLIVAAAAAWLVSQNVDRRTDPTPPSPLPTSAPTTVMATAMPAAAQPIKIATLEPETITIAEPEMVPTTAGPEDLPPETATAKHRKWVTRFEPNTKGGYAVSAVETTPNLTGKSILEPNRAVRTGSVPAWKVAIPFDFPFGGVQWDSCFVNLSGCITFGYADSDARAERHSEGEATPGALAAAIDARAAAGRERMIAPLWRETTPTKTKLYKSVSEESITLSWTQREGAEAFHATLYAGGAIEFAFENVDPNGGFSGVFPGILWAGNPIARVDDLKDSEDPNVDILAFDVEDATSVVQFTLTMAASIPAAVSSGELIHRVTLDTSEGPRQFGVTVTNEPRAWMDWGDEPRIIGYERERERLYMYLSKSLLPAGEIVTAHAEVTWEGFDGLYDRVDEPPLLDLREIHADPKNLDFSTSAESTLGSVYRVF